jgi:hypothetical protein
MMSSVHTASMIFPMSSLLLYAEGDDQIKEDSVCGVCAHGSGGFGFSFRAQANALAASVTDDSTSGYMLIFTR